MKTDFYTKTVLTVIAIFLGIIAFRNVDFITPAQAQKSALSPRKDVIDVNIVSTSSPVDVYLTGNSLSLSTIPVSLQGQNNVKIDGTPSVKIDGTPSVKIDGTPYIKVDNWPSR